MRPVRRALDAERRKAGCPSRNESNRLPWRERVDREPPLRGPPGLAGSDAERGSAFPDGIGRGPRLLEGVTDASPRPGTWSNSGHPSDHVTLTTLEVAQLPRHDRVRLLRRMDFQ